jgi:hypothetical protein
MGEGAMPWVPELTLTKAVCDCPVKVRQDGQPSRDCWCLAAEGSVHQGSRSREKRLPAVRRRADLEPAGIKGSRGRLGEQM